jgi:hypothetical protein
VTPLDRARILVDLLEAGFNAVQAQALCDAGYGVVRWVKVEVR